MLSLMTVSFSCFSADKIQVENASGSPTMLLQTLKIPDITLINNLAYRLVKVDKSEAVKELNEILIRQYGLSDADFHSKNKFVMQSHAEIAALIKNGNIISAYAIVNEVHKLPNASNEKLIDFDFKMIKNSISASYDNDETDAALNLARESIAKIGEPARRDWHTYIYWTIMGKVFNDDIAVKAGLSGLTQTGAKDILASMNSELKILDKKVKASNQRYAGSKGGDD